MAVTLAESQLSGNDHRRISPPKIMLILVQQYLQPSLEIEETRPKDQHHHMCQDQEADAEGQESARPNNCTETEGNKTKV